MRRCDGPLRLVSTWRLARATAERAALLASLCFLLVGCGAGPRARFSTARAAIERLRETTSCSNAVQGEAGLTFAGDGRRLRGKVLYVVQTPEKVRFDVLSPFGVTLSTLTCDGEHFSLYDLGNKTMHYGEPTACNVERFTRVPAPPSVLVELLRGRPPVITHEAAQSSIEYQKGFLASGRYHITLEGAGQVRESMDIGVHPDDYEAPLDRQRLRLLGVELERAGRPIYRAELSGHRAARRIEPKPDPEAIALGVQPEEPSGPSCAAEVPMHLAFEAPESGYELLLDNHEVGHNPPLAPAVFTQEVPGGVRAIESSCVDR